MVHFLLKLLLKQRILAVHHDFRWLMVATKLLTVKLHVMWKIRSRKFWKGQRIRTFYPRLRNPADNTTSKRGATAWIRCTKICPCRCLKKRKMCLGKRKLPLGDKRWREQRMNGSASASTSFEIKDLQNEHVCNNYSEAIFAHQKHQASKAKTSHESMKVYPTTGNHARATGNRTQHLNHQHQQVGLPLINRSNETPVQHSFVCSFLVWRIDYVLTLPCLEHVPARSISIRPVTGGAGEAPLQNFSPPWTNVLDII